MARARIGPPAVGVQTAAPTWVRARALAAYLLVFQGTMVVGSFAWGALVERFGNGTASSVDTFASTSYWWLFRQLMDTVKGDPIAARPGYYPQRNQTVRTQFDQLEQEFAAEVPEIWCRYVRTGDAHILDRFTVRHRIS